MTSPTEPGQSGLGERPAAAEGSAELPPWQTAARNRADGAAQRPAETYSRAGVAAGQAVPVSRYLTGSAAPETPQGESWQAPVADSAPPAAPVATAAAATTAVVDYPSELPDLSGPLPKAAVHRRPSVEPNRPVSSSASSVMTAATSRLQVANRPRGPVRASMQIRRIDPWSALKVSALLSGALFFVWMIAVAFLYLVLGAMGVWAKLNSNVGDLLTSGSGAGGDLVSAGSIFGGAALVGLVNIVLLTAMATIGAYIYNLSTDIVGGVEVTLADLD